MNHSAIIQKLKELGFSPVDKGFYGKIDDWKSWYIGDVKGVHRYRRYNGNKWVKCRRMSLGMAKKVCEDWANLLMNEKVAITAEGEVEQTFLDSVFEKNNFEVRINTMQELKCAVGTVAYIPRVTGQTVSALGGATGGNIVIDCVAAESIYPLNWEGGEITECAFSSVTVQNGHDFLYLQIHRRDEAEEYIIENHVFLCDNEYIEDASTLLIGYKIPTAVYTHSRNRQFVIDRPNIVNNFDFSSPLGVPVYANALDVLRGVDCAYDCYVNEFENCPTMLMVKMPATKWENGEPTLDDTDRRFYLLPEDATQGNVVEPISPPMRTNELNVGLQDMLNMLSSKCGFGENHYRFDGGNVATATQVISENSTMFRTIKKHEIILESALVELCRIILRLGNTALGMNLNENVEISIDFDDSIIENREQDEARVYQMLGAGLMRAEEARAILMNEDIDTAKGNLPGMEDLATEEQDEVE